MANRLLLLCLLAFNARAEIRPPDGASYLGLGLLTLGNVGLMLAETPQSAGWTGRFSLDESIRDELRVASPDGRDAAALTGDLLLYTLIALPTLADAGADTAWNRDDTRTAGRMVLANSQAFLATGILTLAAKKLIARERPYQRECAGDPGYNANCGAADSRQSFFSGHAAFSFTAAGLICAHREHLPLWGGRTACPLAVVAASLVGLTRIFADRHYLTDVLVGAVVGTLSGYGLTKLTYYRGAGPSAPLSLMPRPVGDGLGHHAGLRRGRRLQLLHQPGVERGALREPGLQRGGGPQGRGDDPGDPGRFLSVLRFANPA